MRRTAFATALIVTLFGPVPGTLAQGAAPRGRIVGRVIDGATGKGIADAAIEIVGHGLGAASGVDGQFAIAAAPAGVVTVQVRRIGYTPKQVTGIRVEAGRAVEQDVALAAATTTLAASVVTARVERGTVAEATDQQRLAVGVVMRSPQSRSRAVPMATPRRPSSASVA